MKWIRIKTALLILLFILLGPYEITAETKDGVLLDALLTDVQKTLIRVRDAAEDKGLPPLNKVTLHLKSSLVIEANGKVSLLVVQFGADVVRESLHEIKLELQPPKPADTAPVSAASDALADAIVAAAQSVKQASNRKPPLRLSKLTATVRFVVTRDAGGGVQFSTGHFFKAL